MTSWSDLVREIRAEPDIDAPRLVAADWLTEKTDTRGECIVLDLRLATMDLGAPERSTLLAHRTTIADEAAWAAPLVALGAMSSRGKRAAPIEFRRGFVQSIALVGRASMNFAACCAHEPIVELVVMSAGRRNFASLSQVPELAQVRYLAIGGQHVDGYQALLESPHLGGVRTLALPEAMTPDLARSIASGTARPTYLGPRTWRSAIDPEVTDADLETARVLASTGLLDSLVEVSLHGATDAIVGVLATSPLSAMRKLRIEQCRVSSGGLKALGARLDQLESFHAGGGNWDRSMVPIMIEHMTSRRLRTLSLSGFSDDTIADLIRSPVIANVVDLELLYGAFSPRIATALQETAYRMNLRSLWIAGSSPILRNFRLDGVIVTSEGW